MRLSDYCYRGRHRAPSITGQTAARVATAGVVAAVPVGAAPTAVAAEMPPAVRDAIVACESGGRNVEHGGDPGGVSTASGFYQFVDGSWRAFGGTAYAPRAIEASRAEQDAVADRAFTANGLRDWAASRACWGRRVARDFGDGFARVRFTQRGGRHISTAEAPRHVQPTQPRHAAPDVVTVKAGDTLSKIAAAHGTTWQQLFAANRDIIKSPHLIYPGQRLNV